MEDKLSTYQNLCTRAKELLELYNPCRITDNKCMRGKFCCGGCTYLIGRKCAVDCLVCLLWLCPSAMKEVNEEFKDKARNIFIEGSKQELLVIRGSTMDTVFKANHSYRFSQIQMPWEDVYTLPIPLMNSKAGYCR